MLVKRPVLLLCMLNASRVSRLANISLTKLQTLSNNCDAFRAGAAHAPAADQSGSQGSDSAGEVMAESIQQHQAWFPDQDNERSW